MEDLHFHGGQYGVITQKPSPGWQFTLLDSTFDGQSVAAIKEHEAGLVLRGAVIRDVPAAITIDPGFADDCGPGLRRAGQGRTRLASRLTLFYPSQPRVRLAPAGDRPVF